MNDTSSVSFATSGFLPWIEIGSVRIQSYFIVISLVLSGIAFWVPRRAKDLDYSPRRALDLYIVAMISGLLGSRLFHILWEEPGYYLKNPLLVFDILSGGFVWYGGAIGGFLGIFLMLRRDRPPSLKVWLDLFAPIAAVGYAAGRVACLLTGCCFGSLCHFPTWTHSHSSSPIAFHFPTQAFAIVWELMAAFLLFKAENQRWKNGRRPGQIFSLWIVMHGAGRILMEIFRADPRGPSLFGFTVSMAVSLILILVGMYGLKGSDIHQKLR